MKKLKTNLKNEQKKLTKHIPQLKKNEEYNAYGFGRLRHYPTLRIAVIGSNITAISKP